MASYQTAIEAMLLLMNEVEADAIGPGHDLEARERHLVWGRGRGRGRVRARARARVSD